MPENITIQSCDNVCSIRTEVRFPITKSDWNELKDLIKEIAPDENNFLTFASVLSGLFISTLFYLISIINTDSNVSNWILVSSWVALFTSLIVSIVLFFLHFKQKESVKKISKEFITKRMRRIEEQFEMP